MSDSIKYVGMDVHRDSIAVAIADSMGGEPRFIGKVEPTPGSLITETSPPIISMKRLEIVSPSPVPACSPLQA